MADSLRALVEATRKPFPGYHSDICTVLYDGGCVCGQTQGLDARDELNRVAAVCAPTLTDALLAALPVVEAARRQSNLSIAVCDALDAFDRVVPR